MQTGTNTSNNQSRHLPKLGDSPSRSNHHQELWNIEAINLVCMASRKMQNYRSFWRYCHHHQEPSDNTHLQYSPESHQSLFLDLAWTVSVDHKNKSKGFNEYYSDTKVKRPSDWRPRTANIPPGDCACRSVCIYTSSEPTVIITKIRVAKTLRKIYGFVSDDFWDWRPKVECSKATSALQKYVSITSPTAILILAGIRELASIYVNINKFHYDNLTVEAMSINKNAIRISDYTTVRSFIGMKTKTIWTDMAYSMAVWFTRSNKNDDTVNNMMNNPMITFMLCVMDHVEIVDVWSDDF